MAENSKIEWTDHTFSPWLGCQKVSPGCDRCFAEAWAKRSGLVEWGPHAARRRTSEANWRKPLQWARKAREVRLQYNAIVRGDLANLGTNPPPRPRVFCASLCDVFDNQVPDEWRADLFALIHDTPELDWLLLTKRPENIRKLGCMPTLPWPNIWLGFTAEDQEHFNRRWPIVREIPAAVRFCSYEPAIGPLTLCTGTTIQGLDWLICGGESGPGHRPMEQEWEANIRAECRLHGISYFFKQMAGKKPIPEGYPVVRQFPQPQS